MPLVILSVVIQIALILHVAKTGRPMYWIFIILIAPGIGSLAYFIVEVLPGLSSDYRARRAMRGVRKTLNPDADLRQRKLEHKLSGSVDAARHLAGELVDSGRYKEAIEHYENALTGLFEHDPDLLLGLATAQFGNGDFEKTRDTLDRLIEHNPDFRSAEGHLLYARACEACGQKDKAREEYEAVTAYYAGAEARARYGKFLETEGDAEAALEQYREILTAAELAPRHFRKAQKQWINEAKSGIGRLES